MMLQYHPTCVHVCTYAAIRQLCIVDHKYLVLKKSWQPLPYYHMWYPQIYNLCLWHVLTTKNLPLYSRNLFLIGIHIYRVFLIGSESFTTSCRLEKPSDLLHHTHTLSSSFADYQSSCDHQTNTLLSFHYPRILHTITIKFCFLPSSSPLSNIYSFTNR